MVPERPRVAVIGPVLPFRGGIAQHTTMLRRSLAEIADVQAYSFSRQYPGWLFPGESDRDHGFEGHLEEGTSYSIDSMNPLTWRKTVREIVRTRPDVVVMPWWTVFWAPCFSYISGVLRRRGVPVVFMCHNVVEHESARWKVAFTRAVLRHGKGWVVHTGIDEANLVSLLPDVRPEVYVHPVYDQFPPPQGLLPREHALELLFFGFVRPYKGLDVLLEALALVPEEVDVRLTVAGEFWGGSEAETRRRIAELGLDRRIEVVSRYLGDTEAAEYFGRSHAVMLPYRSATGSGVVAVAYHYGRPVLATRVGGLPDVVLDGVTGFIVEPEDPAALATRIAELARTDLDSMADGVRRFTKENMAWSGLAKAVLRAGGVHTGACRDREPLSETTSDGQERRDA